MIFVFKTNVETKQQVDSMSDQINELFPLSEWNFDLEDCDRIFRISIKEGNMDSIISLFKTNGFVCEEISDHISPKI